VEIRIAEPSWHTDESGAEASLVERLEAEVEALTNKVGRLERRQHRFADMIRLLLELHDQTAARLSSLGVPNDDEGEEMLSAAIGEFSRVMTPGAAAAARTARQPASRRKNA
jgi:aminoglycoside phosphotransferase (APT) family kinase protein